MVPGNIADITAVWLSSALRSSGVVPEATITSVDVEKFGEGVGIIADLYRLTLSYRPGSLQGPRTLIVKLLSSIPQVRELARSYGLYEREVVFYREIAPRISLRTPRCFVAEFDPSSQHFVILMEDLAPAQTGDQLVGMSLEQVRLAIESIATLHARWWDHPELRALEAAIQPLDEPPYAGIDVRYQAAWPKVQAWLAERISRESLRVAERLATGMDRLAAKMTAPPRTICHGDFRADNLMFTREGGALQLFVVDWQVTMQVRGTFDVGYLMSGNVSNELRREHGMELLSLYHRRLIEGGVTGYDFDTCFTDYRRAMLAGYSYWVQSAAAADLTHPRAQALFDSSARRLDAATADLNLAELVS